MFARDLLTDRRVPLAHSRLGQVGMARQIRQQGWPRASEGRQSTSRAGGLVFSRPPRLASGSYFKDATTLAAAPLGNRAAASPYK